MTTMTLDQAKTHLDDLLARAAAGEEVVIVRGDGSTFSVVPLPPATSDGRIGSVENGTDQNPSDATRAESTGANASNGADDAKTSEVAPPTHGGGEPTRFEDDLTYNATDPSLGGFERYLEGDSASAVRLREALGHTAESLRSQRRPRRESFGILKGKIWIAPDFDDIPEGFEPYLGDDYEKDT